MPRDEIRFHRIRITDGVIAECQGHLVLVSILRGDIRSIRLARGVVSELPLVLAGFASICAVAGGTLASGVAYSRLLALGVFLLGAPCLFLLAARRGLILHVETTHGVRKLAIGHRIPEDALARFLEVAKAQGFPIASELPVATVRESDTRT